MSAVICNPSERASSTFLKRASSWGQFRRPAGEREAANNKAGGQRDRREPGVRLPSHLRGRQRLGQALELEFADRSERSATPVAHEDARYIGAQDLAGAGGVLEARRFDYR